MARLEGLINGRRSAFAVQGCGVLIQDSAIVGPGGMTPNSTCHDLMHQLNGKRERTKGRRKDAGLIEGLEVKSICLCSTCRSFQVQLLDHVHS